MRTSPFRAPLFQFNVRREAKCNQRLWVSTMLASGCKRTNNNSHVASFKLWRRLSASCVVLVKTTACKAAYTVEWRRERDFYLHRQLYMLKSEVRNACCTIIPFRAGSDLLWVQWNMSWLQTVYVCVRCATSFSKLITTQVRCAGWLEG